MVAFVLPVPELVVEMQKISTTACLIAKTTNTTAKIWAEISQEMGELM